MNEGERRIEILKAEAAIRDLAGRMAEASESTRQADMARSSLEAAIKSINELNIQFQSVIESQKREFEEERKSLNQASESLDIGVRDLQKAQEKLEKKADHLENSMVERSQELHESIDDKLVNLSQEVNRSLDQLSEKTDHWENSMVEQSQELHESIEARLVNLAQEVNKSQDQLSEKADHLENSMVEQSQELHESIEARLVNLSREVNTISNKLLFVMDQNEASGKRILALQQIIEGLSWNFRKLVDDTANKSEEIQELKTQVIDSNERLSSIEQVFEAKTSGLSHRLRSAIIGGGLGVVMVVMILKLV